MNKYIELIKEHTNNPTINEDSLEENFIDIGLDSLASINLLLDVEEYYNIEISDEMLATEIFKNPKSLWIAIQSLLLEDTN